jgi:hypothetical protein
MLVGTGKVLGQANTVVPANAGGAPPAGQTNVKCTGTYTVPAVPAGQVADHVNVEVYEKKIVGRQVILTLVATLNDGAPAGGNYTTGHTALTTGVEHTFIAYLYTRPAAGGAATLVNPGVTVKWTP